MLRRALSRANIVFLGVYSKNATTYCPAIVIRKCILRSNIRQIIRKAMMMGILKLQVSIVSRIRTGIQEVPSLGLCLRSHSKVLAQVNQNMEI